MGFHIVDGGGGNAGPAQGLGHHRRLRVGIRHGVAVGSAAGINGTAFQHGIDVVPVLDGLRQRLENDRAHALRRDEAVRPVAKRFAFGACGEHPQLGQADVVSGG